MRLYRNAIILIAVLALLGGAYFFVSKAKGKDTAQEQSTDPTVKILTQDYEKVSQVSINNNEGEILVKKEGDKWVLKKPTDLKSSEDQVSELVSNLTAAFTADRLIEEKATDLKSYGLSQPYAELIITYTDNKSQTLEIGDKTPTQDAYYVLDKDTSKLYSVSTYTTEKILNARKEVLQKKLFPAKIEDVTGVALEKAGKLVFNSQRVSDTEWHVSAPITALGNVDKLNPMANAMIALTASKYVEENATDLGKYGLGNPPYSLELKTKSGSSKIFIGTKAEDSKENYARMADSNAVFTLDTSSLTFLDTPLREVVDGFAYIVNINDVSQIDVEMDGQKNTLTVETDGEDRSKDKFFLNGKDATMKDEKQNQYFRNYYQTLIGLALDNIDLGAAPTAAPEVTITYTLKKAPGKVKVELVPKDKYYYYIMRDGKYTNMIIAKSKLDEPEGMRDSFKKLYDAVNKK